MRERVLGTRRVYDGRVVSLRVDEVTLPGGGKTQREIVEHHGAVAVVPVAGRDVYLVRQYRRAAGRALLEIPAGTLEPGERPVQALRRELAEEIGVRAARVRRLAAFYPSPGFLTEIVHLYLATGLRPARRQAEEDEDLEVVRVSLGRAMSLVNRGEIRDAKSIIGLLMASRLRR